MKLALLSDIHANLQALQACLDMQSSKAQTSLPCSATWSATAVTLGW